MEKSIRMIVVQDFRETNDVKDDENNEDHRSDKDKTTKATKAMTAKSVDLDPFHDSQSMVITRS